MNAKKKERCLDFQAATEKGKVCTWKVMDIDAAKKDFPVARLCKVLNVSPSGYFAWKNRQASTRQREDLVLLAHVRSAFTLSHETYGSPRMTHELRE